MQSSTSMENAMAQMPEPGQTSLGGVPAPLGNSQMRHTYTFGIPSTSPLVYEPNLLMPRADEVETILRMLGSAQTGAVMLIGMPGAGRSTLASLLYQRVRQAQQAGAAAPRHVIWLTLGTYSTLPDVLFSLLDALQASEVGFFQLTAEQQVTTLLNALRRPQDPALIILDQFELLLYPEIQQGTAGRGSLSLFLNLLQMDLGGSRILLTSHQSPYDEQMETTRVRSYLVSRISMPEGVMLLQQYGVQGSPEELSLLWQRCSGHAFALCLSSGLMHLGDIALSYLLNAPDYQPLWNGEVTLRLIAEIYRHFTPMQYAVMRALSLFAEPVPLFGIMMAVGGNAIPEPAVQERSYTVFERELAILVQYALVQRVINTAGMTCYLLHPLIRQYIQEHYLEGSDRSNRIFGNPAVTDASSVPAPDSPEARRAALMEGHVQVAYYYQHVVGQHYKPRSQRTTLQDVGGLIAMLRHLCLGGRWQYACDLLFEEELHESMVRWGAFNALIGLYTALLPPFGMLQRQDEALVASHLGTLYGRIGEYQQSQAYYEQAVIIEREQGNIRSEAATLTNQGEILRQCGEWEAALACYERALVLEQQQPDLLLRCVLWHDIALLYQGAKDYQTAQTYYARSLALAYQMSQEQMGNKRVIILSNLGMILTNFGVLLYEQKRIQDALALLLASFQVRQSLQDPSLGVLERLLMALERKIGAVAYAQLYQAAQGMQQQTILRFIQEAQ